MTNICITQENMYMYMQYSLSGSTVQVYITLYLMHTIYMYPTYMNTCMYLNGSILYKQTRIMINKSS